MKLAMVMRTSGSLSGGARKHFDAITPRLLAHPDISEMQIVVPGDAIRAIDPKWPVINWRAGLLDHFALRAALQGFGADVAFVPSARHVAIPGAKTVVMVRNMEPLETPFAGNGLVDRAKNIARAVAARTACHRADRIIAVSNHVRDHVVAWSGINPARVATVYHGVEPPGDRTRPESLSELRGRPFVFSAGSIRPARGLIDLVSALADRRLPDDLQMVFAGTVDRGAEHYFAELKHLAEELGIADRIHWLGHCDRARMSWCFANSAIFVMTSRAEACPNTVLEALSHGCLSVSGDNAPMPEFFGNAALYYRNGDSVSLAAKMAQAFSLDNAANQILRTRARELSQHFSWDICVQKTVQELKQACEMPSVT